MREFNKRADQLANEGIKKHNCRIKEDAKHKVIKSPDEQPMDKEAGSTPHIQKELEF
jgi:hypothetical protein